MKPSDIYDNNKRISWTHAVLVLSKKISTGSAKANNDFRQQLLSAGSIDAIYDDYFSLVPVDNDIAEKALKKIEKFDSSFEAITCLDNRYPDSLLAFPGTPPIIYTQGDCSLLYAKKSIAFVGTRKLDNPTHIDHGRRVIKRLIDAGHDAIVSGLAEGSDTLGHIYAMKYGGRTIAVLGTPIDMFYPKSNSDLQREIAKTNLIISEYPIGIGSFGSFFANRNRTTVSLSTHGIVVARASNKSGTQHAIRVCLEQSKQLYVLENNIMDPEYTWTSKFKSNIKVIRDICDAGSNI